MNNIVVNVRSPVNHSSGLPLIVQAVTQLSWNPGMLRGPSTQRRTTRWSAKTSWNRSRIRNTTTIFEIRGVMMRSRLERLFVCWRE